MMVWLAPLQAACAPPGAPITAKTRSEAEASSATREQIGPVGVDGFAGPGPLCALIRLQQRFAPSIIASGRDATS
jgi:hypothetical protein